MITGYNCSVEVGVVRTLLLQDYGYDDERTRAHNLSIIIQGAAATGYTNVTLYDAPINTEVPHFGPNQCRAADNWLQRYAARINDYIYFEYLAKDKPLPRPGW